MVTRHDGHCRTVTRRTILHISVVHYQSRLSFTGHIWSRAAHISVVCCAINEATACKQTYAKCRYNSADTFTLAIAEPLPSKIEIYFAGHTSEHMHIERTIGARSAVINDGTIKWNTLQSTVVEDQTFLYLVQDNVLTQHVLEPTRAARILYIVLSSQKEFADNVVIQEPLGDSDHNQLHFNIKIKSVKTKVKQCRRDFRKGNYKEIRKRLEHIDENDKMKSKTAAECWHFLRGEIYSAIDSFVPMKKQGKRSKKKHLSKEAFRKIRHKQNMWRVYKQYGKGSRLDPMWFTKRH